MNVVQRERPRAHKISVSTLLGLVLSALLIGCPAEGPEDLGSSPDATGPSSAPDSDLAQDPTLQPGLTGLAQSFTDNAFNIGPQTPPSPRANVKPGDPNLLQQRVLVRVRPHPLVWPRKTPGDLGAQFLHPMEATH